MSRPAPLRPVVPSEVSKPTARGDEVQAGLEVPDEQLAHWRGRRVDLLGDNALADDDSASWFGALFGG